VEVGCWFNKKHPNALYIDIRREPKGFLKQRPNFSVEPDELGDYTNLKYPNKRFKLVVWDPPHTIRPGRHTTAGVIAMRYGRLFSDEWKRNSPKAFGNAGGSSMTTVC
jgi:hypothetical protein